MVQIRRKRRGLPRDLRRSIGGILQFCIVSSVIPGTFWARHALFAKKQSMPNIGVTVIDKGEPPAAAATAEAQVAASSEGGGTTTAAPSPLPVYLSFSTEDPELEFRTSSTWIYIFLVTAAIERS